MSRRGHHRLVALACAAAMLTAGCDGDVVSGRGSPARTSAGTSTSSAGSATRVDGARFADPAAVSALLADVRIGVEAINSYDYRALDAARTRALRYTTDAYAADYLRTFRTVIEKNAPGLKAAQQARVIRAGVATSTADEATLLLFGRLDVTTAAAPGGRVDPFAVNVRAERVAGRWRIAQVDLGGAGTTTVTGSAGLRAAVTAARVAVTGFSSFRRARFESDFARALSLVTGTLRGDLLANKATTLAALRKGNFDLRAAVTSIGVEDAEGDRATVLVTLDSYRIVNGSRSGTATKQNLRLVVDRVGGRWLVSEAEAVGVS